jgi:hypothetical protein
MVRKGTGEHCLFNLCTEVVYGSFVKHRTRSAGLGHLALDRSAIHHNKENPLRENRKTGLAGATGTPTDRRGRTHRGKDGPLEWSGPVSALDTVRLNDLPMILAQLQREKFYGRISFDLRGGEVTLIRTERTQLVNTVKTHQGENRDVCPSKHDR